MQTTVNSIKDLFMGNPGALQNRIQKEQQAKPGIPPDLRELLALQEIQDQHQAMQRQQALQNPANQPTIADKLKQTLATQQQQMAQAGLPGAQGMPPQQPQHQPQMGLDQIQSNLGEYYGGGIVAFDGTQGSQVKDEYETPYDRMNRRNREAEAAEEAKLKTPEGRAEQIRKDRLAMLNLPAAAADIVGGPINYLAQTGESIANKIGIPRLGRALGIYDPDVTSVGIPRIGSGSNTPYTDMLRSANKAPVESEKSKPLPDYTNDLAPGMRAGQPITEAPPKPPAPRPPGLPGSPRVQPSVEQAPVAQEPQDPLTAALEKQILGNLSVDKDAKARARRKETEQYLGLDTLAAAQRERAQKEYDMQKQQAQGRNAFSAFTAGINPYARTLAEGLRGGQQTLAAATAGWDKSDFEALQNYNKALSGIDTQTVAGKKFALEAEDTLFKDLSAEARNALTSGTSLVNTRENAAARKQAAKDAAAARVAAATEGRLGREAAAQIAKDTRADAAADKQDARYREQAMRLAVAAATEEKKRPANITTLKDVKIEDLAATMFDRYYQMLKSGKMPESPGAESPGASAPSGWGQAQRVNP